MLPGKKYTPEDFLKIAWARKWLIVIPAVVALAGTIAWARQLPNVYRSEARILIVPQRVPTAFVQSTVTTGLSERLQSITQQIVSRTKLERLIEDFNLYPEQRQTMPMEDVVEQMRKDLGVDIPKVARNVQPGYFTVRYDSPNPQTAMKVAERLASFFIDENVQQREGQANLTAEFLSTQLADAKEKLLQHEQKLEEYRRKYGPEMPSQMQSNIQLMQTTQVQLQALADSATRDQERKVAINRLLADAATQKASAVIDSVQPAATPGAGTTAQQLEAERAALRALQLRLTPEHPDVIRAQKRVRELEKKAEAEALDVPLGATPPPAKMTPAQLADQKRVNDLKGELDMIDQRLADNQAQQSRLQGMLSELRARLEAAPTRETELTELTRDYATIQGTYNSLLAKSQESDIAANLERRQISEQFRLLDPPRLPQRPISPNRPRMLMMGLGAGLGLGLLIAGLLEYRDTTFATDSELVATLSVPVLAVVPAMVTTRERDRARRVRRLAWSVTGMAIVAGGGLAVWKLWLVGTLGR